MTKTFRDLGVDPSLCDVLAEGGITHPFPIQELTLPLALDGHDLIGQARTGTGKTLAFGLPLLQRLDPTSTHTQALVIVPTRELCLQVYSDLQIGSAKGLTSISVYGGVGYDEQIDALTSGAHVVVGTPGRLLDLLNRGVLDLSHVTQLVLDEADEMLDMGFLPDVERLVESCKGEDRHTMLFSATMPTAIVKLARRYMDHPTFTRADHEQKNTAPLVTQYFFEVHRMDKPRLLARILQSKHRGGVYVFVRTKHMADRLVNDLEELRIPSIAIHGDLRQSTREKNLDRFRSGQATVLVCTEVAARGLDVTGVTHVINYDCPDDEKMYLHRIGRTARAGESGVAITFAEFNEIDRLNVIRKAVGATESSVQQVFSTSKQLAEMFELPEERPWDHLTTKAGSDEARAARESRSDGKPKSGRTQEGRGGDHDARRPARRSDGGQDAARGKRSDERSKSGERGKSDERSSGKRSDERSSGKPSDDRGKPSDERSSDDRGKRSDGGRRDRGRGRDTEAADGARSDAPRRTERAAQDDAAVPADEAVTAPAADAAPEPTTRTRTRTRARPTTAGARGSGPQRARGSDAPSSSTTKSETGESADAPAEQGAPEPRSSPTGGGRQRARGSQRGGTRSSQDAKRSDEKANSSDADRRGARSGSRGGGGGGSRSRGSAGKDAAGRRGGGGREPAGDPTVTVAGRGEDARGDGQPQVARRVKVEHLP